MGFISFCIGVLGDLIDRVDRVDRVERLCGGFLTTEYTEAG